ncbi:MAG TPA: choice-of-anchor tandem repeat GloVer-containing protein [Terriglobales bacterium]
MARKRRATIQRLRVTVLIFGLCVAAQAAPEYKVLFNFNGADGNAPWGGVSVGNDGAVYGASGGGGTGPCTNGCGLLFKISRKGTTWAEDILYSFQGGADGLGPTGGVTVASDGTLLGTTTWGGTEKNGTVWKLAPLRDGWSEKVLYSFPGDAQGCCPESGVVISNAGKLYGTAAATYELEPEPDGWKYSVLHEFLGQDGDGYDPFAGVIRDDRGNLYGTTEYGGNQCGSSSCGTVYELSPEPDGKWKEAILHRFNDKASDGTMPGWGALYMDSAGSLYGTTAGGGCCGGVIFRLSPRNSGGWTYTILYDFKGGALGYEPNTGVVMGRDGSLYGTTDYGGGPNSCGVLYKLAPTGNDKWQYSVLHVFGEGNDGCVPEGDLVIDQQGNLYGSLVLGGEYGYGAIFELSTVASPQ